MQKWEYVVIWMAFYDGKLKFYAVNDVLDKSYDAKTSRATILNVWGEQGWELVAIDGQHSIFKRPKN